MAGRFRQKIHLYLRPADTLIAHGRALLALFFLLSVWIDPSEPTRFAEATYQILAGYAAYSLFLCIPRLRRAALGSLIHVTAHIVDLVVFAILMFLTQGPTSPFFVYFVFLLVCAALRWQWRGTLITAAIALTVVVAVAFYPRNLLLADGFELNRFIMRIVYLGVVATLLGYFGAYNERLRSLISGLADWPPPAAGDFGNAAGKLLEQAAPILQARRLLLVWEDEEEPWLHMALWRGDDLQYARRSCTEFGDVVSPAINARVFFCTDAGGERPSVVGRSGAHLRTWNSSPLDAGLVEQFHLQEVLGMRLGESTLRRYLFGLDKPYMSEVDLLLGAVVAGEVEKRLEHFLLLQRQQEAAAVEERVRMARDLHDGLLQSLTAAAIQLQAVNGLMDREPKRARKLVQDIQGLIAREQRSLRLQVDALKPTAASAREPLENRLQELARTVERHWGLRVEMQLQQCAEIPPSLWQELYFMIHEGLVNAARHAGATIARVEVKVEDGIRVGISDNGHGFPFTGHFDHAILRKRKMGPITLQERAMALGGGLSVDSGREGSTIAITLPAAEEERYVHSSGAC